MSSSSKFFVLNNIKLPLDASSKEAFSVASKRLRSIGVDTRTLRFKIYKKSTDARNRKDVKFVYSILAEGESKDISEKLLNKIDASIINRSDEINYLVGNEPLSAPPLVVGSGPAGMFSALLLA